MVLGGIDNSDIAWVEGFTSGLEAVVDLISSNKSASTCWWRGRLVRTWRERGSDNREGTPAPTTTTLYLSLSSEIVA